MNFQVILSFLKANPIIIVLIVIMLMFSVGFASKNGANKYYAKYFKEQLKIEKELIEAKYEQQLKDLKEAKEKAEEDLNDSKNEVNKLNGILNGLTIKEDNIITPETYEEIQKRFRRLGYETSIINSNTP